MTIHEHAERYRIVEVPATPPTTVTVACHRLDGTRESRDLVALAGQSEAVLFRVIETPVNGGADHVWGDFPTEREALASIANYLRVDLRNENPEAV